MAQATLSCPLGAIHLEDRRGTAQDKRSALIFALPPVPHYGGYPFQMGKKFPARKI